MPMMPFMPASADQVATPMPGGPPGGAYPPNPTGPGPAGDLATLMGLGGASSPMGGVDPLQGALGQFDILAQLIDDLARTFPGSEQIATQMMEALNMWKQQALMMTTPQPSSMPGADMMM